MWLKTHMSYLQQNLTDLDDDVTFAVASIEDAMFGHHDNLAILFVT